MKNSKQDPDDDLLQDCKENNQVYAVIQNKYNYGVIRNTNGKGLEIYYEYSISHWDIDV